MKLTAEIIKKLPKLYAQDGAEDPTVYVKFFDPTGSSTWYITEGEEQEDDFRLFGYFQNAQGGELGYFSLNEILHAKDGIQGIRSVPVERDLYFDEQPLSKAKGR